MSVTGVTLVQRNLAAYVVSLRAALAAAMEEIRALLKAEAHDVHDWQNRTGDTEASIDAVITEATEAIIQLTVFAAMPYDVFVELAHGGRWSWLWPAITRNQDRILAILVKYGIEATVSGKGFARGTLTGPMTAQLQAQETEF
jgi:hypothetical protein